MGHRGGRQRPQPSATLCAQDGWLLGAGWPMGPPDSRCCVPREPREGPAALAPRGRPPRGVTADVKGKRGRRPSDPKVFCSAPEPPGPRLGAPQVRTPPHSGHRTGRTSVGTAARPPPGRCRPSPGKEGRDEPGRSGEHPRGGRRWRPHGGRLPGSSPRAAACAGPETWQAWLSSLDSGGRMGQRPRGHEL